ncbi:hypothetical protein N7534_008323 [Penicillium rubens]|jgi:hypothetical protein|nr:hypothetical protein N7524_003652 [Penicillium chrysogenum]KAJ5849005.1 hypothetical protein N7534_008323 [Penicillium rubens]
MASIRSILLVIALALQGSEALPDCQSYIHSETIAYFNSAPITFSYELATALDCQRWCEKVSKCQAWVYVEQSNQCDLHRTEALSVSDNAGFIFGGCKPRAANESRTAPTPSSSLHSVVISTPTSSETAYLVRSHPFQASCSGLTANILLLKAHARREILRHKHKGHHPNL